MRSHLQLAISIEFSGTDHIVVLCSVRKFISSCHPSLVSKLCFYSNIQCIHISHLFGNNAISNGLFYSVTVLPTGVTAADLTRQQTLPSWRILAPPCGGAVHPADFGTTLGAEYLTRLETLPALILTGIDARVVFRQVRYPVATPGGSAHPGTYF